MAANTTGHLGDDQPLRLSEACETILAGRLTSKEPRCFAEDRCLITARPPSHEGQTGWDKFNDLGREAVGPFIAGSLTRDCEVGETKSTCGPMAPRCLTRDQAAAYCGLEPVGFDAWVRRGIVPGAIPGTRRWDRHAIDAALDKRSGLASPSPVGELSPYDEWKVREHARQSAWHSQGAENPR
jgi:hypothetical protein